MIFRIPVGWLRRIVFACLPGLIFLGGTSCIHAPLHYVDDDDGYTWSLIPKPLRVRVCPPHAKLEAQNNCPTLRFERRSVARSLATGLAMSGKDRIYIAVASENTHCLSGCEVNPSLLTFHVQGKTLRSGPCRPLRVFNQQGNRNDCFDGSCSLAGLVYDEQGQRLLALRPSDPARLYAFPMQANRCPDGSVRSFALPVENTNLLDLMILPDEPRLTLALFGEDGFFGVIRFQDGVIEQVPTPGSWKERLEEMGREKVTRRKPSPWVPPKGWDER